jgi:protoporphyrinogen IX oxidase
MTAEGRTAMIRAAASLLITAALIAGLIFLWPARLYAWMLAIHLMAVISWMAGMFYLPRLFVYHCDAEPGSVQSETFKTMERRLLTQIINPAMIATWATGIWLISAGGFIHSGWMQAKLVLVILLSGYHGMLSAWTRRFANDQNTRSHVFYRVMNEVPTVLMIGIVILVVIKPF